MAAAKKSTSGSRRQSTANSRTKRETTKKTTANSPKKTATRGSARKNTTTRKRTSTTKKTPANRGKSIEEINEYNDKLAFEIGVTVIVIAIVSIFLYLCFFGFAGKAGTVVGGLFFGFFGWFAWFVPIVTVLGSTTYLVNRGDKRVWRKIFGFTGIVLTILGLCDLIFGQQIITEYYMSNHVMHPAYTECMYLTCDDVMSQGKFNGGLIGRATSSVFSVVIGKIGAGFLLFALLLLCIYIFYGVEIMRMIRKRNAYRQEMKEVYEQISDDEEFVEPSYRMFRGKKRISRQDLEEDEVLERRVTSKTSVREPVSGEANRIQTFDLKKINERLDQMEKSMNETLAKQREAQKNQKGNSDGDEKKSSVKNAKLGTQSLMDNTVDSEELLETATQESEIKIPLRNTEIDQIPIYRNEMKQKFGERKKSKKKLTPKKIIHEDEIVEEPLANGVIEVSDVIESTDKVIEEFDKEFAAETDYPEISVKEESSQSNESVETDDKIVAPFEHTSVEEQDFEKVNDTQNLPFVTPEEDEVVEAPHVSQTPSQVSAPVVSEGAVAMARAMAKDHDHTRKVKEHGKFGGDDYVSGSDTFNALNESKVSVEEDKPYEFPSLDLLSVPKNNGNAVSDSELRMTASKLQDTLKSFNVNVQMGAVTCGPTVTRYELLPEQGVRVNKITNLADDLKLSMAATSIRIEAPIPGKAAVGIEVPNPTSSPVYFRELLEGDTFTNSKSDLTFAVGKDIAGKLIMADIGKMPHLLIAGATGSGKSVCINTLIMSILYKANPKDVKLIMIDPKVVELSVYNGIPHLFCPVVTDPKEAAAALNWAVREMGDRYNKFKELGVRNIAGYNEKIKSMEDAAENGYAKMPYLVVIVDEFADLMMVASKDVEDAVCRLAQLARAAGIHLVLATQRPSVNVITGVIKANIPSRIAFSVSSAIDSRTILDRGGAEKLLGKGDMLFFPAGYSEPIRVQGAFVADKEVSDIVDFLRDNNETPEYNHAVTEIVEAPKEEEVIVKKAESENDEYFEDAGRFVIESDRAAAGQLQRRFSIGFNRAGRIIDQLNKAGVVGPAEGTKPRKVLMTMEEFEAMMHGGEAIDTENAEQMTMDTEENVATMEEF